MLLHLDVITMVRDDQMAGAYGVQIQTGGYEGKMQTKAVSDSDGSSDGDGGMTVNIDKLLNTAVTAAIGGVVGGFVTRAVFNDDK